MPSPTVWAWRRKTSCLAAILNTKNDLDFFTFNILFEGYDISSIPPPPPPPMPNEFDIEK